MTRKTEQLQIRVTPGEKAALKRMARRAGLDVSRYVLARALPDQGRRFEALMGSLRRGRDRRYVLAEVNDLLSGLSPTEFAAAVGEATVEGLAPLEQNYVAAMVEQAATLKGVDVPAWTGNVVPLEEPWFAAPLKRIRLHLLRSSPIAFRRRNLFVDAGIGARV